MAFRQFIHNTFVTFDARFPPSLLHALTKALKEDVQQITECDERLQPARIQQRTMKLDIQLDPRLQIARRPELLDEFSQPSFDRRIFLHPSRDVRQHSGFEDHAAVDELLRIGLQQAGMKRQMLREPLHIDASHRQSDPGFRFDDPEKLQRLGGFTKAQPTDAKRLRKLSLRRQPITGTEFLLDNVLLDLTSNLITDFEATKRLHEFPLTGCRRKSSSIDYLTIIRDARDCLDPIASAVGELLRNSATKESQHAMPTVAITDYTFPDLELERSILSAGGFELRSGNDKQIPALKALVAEADAVITQFAPINAEVIGAMQRAKVIVRYGIGYDNVDVKAARERGIPVCNIPDYCIDEVADHTLAFILGVTRQVVPNTLHVRDCQWGLATPLDQLRTLRDQTVGLVGFGRIGREVAARLGPFKCRRLVHDAFVPADAVRAAGCEPVTLDELLAQSDIVSLHCPSTPQTKKLLNADSLGRMKRGAVVVNLARGDLIDTTALVNALQTGQIASAALDVCDPEPIPADSPLRSLSNVIVASHIASASPKAVRTLRETAAKLAVMALRGEPLPNVVDGVAQ